jgi:hypothetical protein
LVHIANTLDNSAYSPERLLAPVAPVPLLERAPGRDAGTRRGPAIECWTGSGSPTWILSGDWRLFARPCTVIEDRRGDVVASFRLADGTVLYATWDEETSRVSIPFSLGEALANYLGERWRETSPGKRLSEQQLNFFYRVKRFVPRRVQIAARRVLVRWQHSPLFPAWPADESIARLLRLYAHCAMIASRRHVLHFRWFWPFGQRAALILTHDVETAEGLRLAVEVADLEEELGFRSSFNVGSWYGLDDGILRELRSRGFEIGSHGLQHDRSLFASRAAFETQLPLLADAMDTIHAEGFRSPSTFRVFEWFAELPAAYDCSVPHSDPYEPQPGGCCSFWPFFIGPLIELPYTLPQDHTLFTLLKHRAVDFWLQQAATIERNHGLIQCVTHPDPGYLGEQANRMLYAEFLEGMATRPHLWRALPRDVARWWRFRQEARDVGGPLATGVARTGATPDEVVFEAPPAEPMLQELTEDLARSLERVPRLTSPGRRQ